MAFAAVVFFHFFESDQQDRAMKGKEVDMPGHGSEVIDPGKRRVEKEITKQQLEQNAEIDERVGDKVEQDKMPVEKPRKTDHNPPVMARVRGGAGSKWAPSGNRLQAVPAPAGSEKILCEQRAFP